MATDRAGSVVGVRLREARLAAGLSQAELGIRAGIDPFVASPRINQYERGKHLPNPEVLALLGVVLNKPLPYFYARDDDMAMVIVAYAKATGAMRKKFLELARPPGGDTK